MRDEVSLLWPASARWLHVVHERSALPGRCVTLRSSLKKFRLMLLRQSTACRWVSLDLFDKHCIPNAGRTRSKPAQKSLIRWRSPEAGGRPSPVLQVPAKDPESTVANHQSAAGLMPFTRLLPAVLSRASPRSISLMLLGLAKDLAARDNEIDETQEKSKILGQWWNSWEGGSVTDNAEQV